MARRRDQRKPDTPKGLVILGNVVWIGTFLALLGWVVWIVASEHLR